MIGITTSSRPTKVQRCKLTKDIDRNTPIENSMIKSSVGVHCCHSSQRVSLREDVIKFEATRPTIMQGRKRGSFKPAEANAEFINCPAMTQTLIENAADKRLW